MYEKEIDPRRIGMAKNYSITFAHVNMVKEMADELTAKEGKLISDGEVVRRAIDMLYGKIFPDDPVLMPEAV